MKMKPALSVRELLEETFKLLKNNLKGEEIKLPEWTMSEIASDDLGPCRKIGYTGYESAVILKMPGTTWMICFGTACGEYPAGKYNCDIAAIPFKLNDKPDYGKTIAHEAKGILENNRCFYNSLIYAMADGRLAVNKDGRFEKRVLDLLAPKIKHFTAGDLAYDSEHLTMDLEPVIKSAVTYKPEFAVFLLEKFKTVLAEHSK